MIYKKAIRLHGKRINFIIELTEFDNSLKFLKRQCESDPLDYPEYLVELFLRYKIRQIEEICFEIIMKNIALAIERYTNLIFSPLYITIKIYEGGPSGEFAAAAVNPKLCKPNYMFLLIGSNTLFQEVYTTVFKKDRDFHQEIKKTYPTVFSSEFKKVLEHEFVHYLDLTKIKEKNMVYNKFEKYPMYVSSTFEIFTKFRSEGLAEIVSHRNKNSLFFTKSKIDTLKSNLMEGKLMFDDPYFSGMFMYYFIGLYLLYRKRRDEFNQMKAYTKDEEYFHFGYGINNILNISKEIHFQNLPSDIIDYLLKKSINWSHIKFTKEYEHACNKLNIEERNRIISLREYNKLKKENYYRWVKEIKKQKFPVPPP